MSEQKRLFQLSFHNLRAVSIKDTEELKAFSRRNKLFAFITRLPCGNYYLHFFTSNNYQFALATQKRPDRMYQVRTFKNIDTAVKYAEKFGIKSVTVLLRSSKLMIADGYLLIQSSQFSGESID